MEFRVIEGETDFSEIYEDFKKDFLNPELYIRDITKKYNLTYGEYCKIRKQVVEETGVKIKPNKYHPSQISMGTSYIHRTKNNKFTVCKYHDNRKIFYGTYDDLETAQLIRDELIKCNWDKKQLNRIRNKIFKDLKQQQLDNMRDCWMFLNNFHNEYQLPGTITFEIPASGSRAGMIIVTLHHIDQTTDLDVWLQYESIFKQELNLTRVDVEEKESWNNNRYNCDISYIYKNNSENTLNIIEAENYKMKVIVEWIVLKKIGVNSYIL